MIACQNLHRGERAAESVQYSRSRFCLLLAEAETAAETNMWLWILSSLEERGCLTCMQESEMTNLPSYLAQAMREGTQANK